MLAGFHRTWDRFRMHLQCHLSPMGPNSPIRHLPLPYSELSYDTSKSKDIIGLEMQLELESDISKSYGTTGRSRDPHLFLQRESPLDSCICS